MLIIVEGPDCAGKSTFVSKIAAAISAQYFSYIVEVLHRGPPTSHPLDEYVVPLLTYRPGTGRDVICDRWHLGELVYPGVLRRPTHMDEAVSAYVNAFLTARGALTVKILPDLETIRRCFSSRDDTSTALDQLSEVWRGFDQLPTSLVISERPSDDHVELVIKCARDLEQLNRVAAHLTFVGDDTPNALLLGDVRSCTGVACHHTTRHRRSDTAFMPYPGTSGHFLFKSLTAAGVDDRVAVANACDVDDVRAIYADVTRRDVRPPRLVALGARACGLLCSRELPHATVPHPQFIRRFHHRHHTEYGHLISDVITTSLPRRELAWRPS